MTRVHPKTTVYRLQTPAGGFLRLYEQSGMYHVESDGDAGLIDPTASFGSARSQFEHILAERYGFEWVQGPSAMYLMDPRSGKPLMIDNPTLQPPDYGSW